MILVAARKQGLEDAGGAFPKDFLDHLRRSHELSVCNFNVARVDDGDERRLGRATDDLRDGLQMLGEGGQLDEPVRERFEDKFTGFGRGRSMGSGVQGEWLREDGREQLPDERLCFGAEDEERLEQVWSLFVELLLSHFDKIDLEAICPFVVVLPEEDDVDETPAPSGLNERRDQDVGTFLDRYRARAGVEEVENCARAHREYWGGSGVSQTSTGQPPYDEGPRAHITSRCANASTDVQANGTASWQFV